jgi:hypothetical protein
VSPFVSHHAAEHRPFRLLNSCDLPFHDLAIMLPNIVALPVADSS